MTEHRLREGTTVQIVATGPFGTLDRIDGLRFADETVTKGDRGTYHATQVENPGWHFIRFAGLGSDGTDRFCPLPEVAFREWRPSRRNSPGTDSLASLLP